MVCFFSFLFFLLISDKGALGSYLQELSQDARSKIERHLEARENMIQELSLSLASTERRLNGMLQGSFDTSRDALFALQHIVKKLSRLHIRMQTKYRLDGILL